MKFTGCIVSFLLLLSVHLFSADKILYHDVVLDARGKLQAWTSYDNIIRWSMNCINNCPTVKTKFDDDPWYLITAKFNPDGTFRRKRNNQGSNVYWSVETLRKYYAYSGDRTAFAPVRRLLERVARCLRSPWESLPRA